MTAKPSRLHPLTVDPGPRGPGDQMMCRRLRATRLSANGPVAAISDPSVYENTRRECYHASGTAISQRCPVLPSTVRQAGDALGRLSYAAADSELRPAQRRRSSGTQEPQWVLHLSERCSADRCRARPLPLSPRRKPRNSCTQSCRAVGLPRTPRIAGQERAQAGWAHHYFHILESKTCTLGALIEIFAASLWAGLIR